MNKVYALLFIIIAMLLGSCQKYIPGPGGNDQPVSSSDTPTPAVTAVPQEFELGEAAYIDSIDAVFLESFPLQVHALLKGNFPDGCTSIQRHEVKREENTFTITIFTQRPKGAFCTEALVPFEYTVPLDVYGLPAGNYLVKSSDAAAEFTFSKDNILQGSGGG